MIRLKIKQPNSMIAVELARERARLVGHKQYINSMRTSSMHFFFLLYLSRLLSYSSSFNRHGLRNVAV